MLSPHRSLRPLLLALTVAWMAACTGTEAEVVQLPIPINFTATAAAASVATAVPPAPTATAASVATAVPPAPTATAASVATAVPPAPTATAASVATAVPPAPTATAASVATAVPPAPTATAASVATAIPPAPTATAAPPSAPTLQYQPQHVPQGGVLTVTVSAGQPIRGVTGSLGGRALVFALAAGAKDAWSVAGFRSDAALSPQGLAVAVETEDGVRTQLSGIVQVVDGGFPVEHITIPPDQSVFLDPGVLNREWDKLLSIARQVTGAPLWEGSFSLPTQGPMTSPYGIRRSYNNGPPSPHEGHDIGAEAGAPVMASNNGVVAVAATWEVRGNVVIINHGMGLYSGYYHLSEIAVAPGQPVTKGQFIGKVGETGLVTGPHLHWEVILRGSHVAPLQWTDQPFPR